MPGLYIKFTSQLCIGHIFITESVGELRRYRDIRVKECVQEHYAPMVARTDAECDIHGFDGMFGEIDGHKDEVSFLSFLPVTWHREKYIAVFDYAESFRKITFENTHPDTRTYNRSRKIDILQHSLHALDLQQCFKGDSMVVGVYRYSYQTWFCR